jgi:hypothetical protein
VREFVFDRFGELDVSGGLAEGVEFDGGESLGYRGA